MLAAAAASSVTAQIWHFISVDKEREREDEKESRMGGQGEREEKIRPRMFE